MKCPGCQKDVPDDMRLCGYCGARLVRAEPEDPKDEMEVWQGAYSGKALAHLWIFYGLFVAALGLIFVNLPVNTGSGVQFLFAGLFALPPAALVGFMLYKKVAIRYRLTSQRFFRSRGILIHHQDELELVRIDDLQIRRSLLNRMLDVGTITIFAPTDASHPQLVVDGVADPMRVKELIREAVQRRRGGAVRFEQI